MSRSLSPQCVPVSEDVFAATEEDKCYYKRVMHRIAPTAQII